VIETAVQPPTDHSTEAAAEPTAPPTKLPLMYAVLSLLLASPEIVNSRD